MRLVRPMTRIGLISLLLLSSVGGVTSAEAEVAAPSNSKAVSDAEDPSRFSRAIEISGQKVSLTRGVELVVGEGAAAEPKFTSRLPVGEKGAKVLVQTVDVQSGRVDAFLPKAAEERGVLLQAPDKILGISTGGHMVVTVTKEEVAISASEGDVLVGQDAKFRPLKEGMIRVISRQSGVSQDFPLPSKVSLSANQGLAVALSGSVDVPLAVKGKQALLLAVTSENGTRVGPVKTFAAGAPLEVTIPRAGTYFAVARAIGKSGIEGEMSDPVRIQVLGLAQGQSPPVGGVFLLDRGERVRLAGTDGLEVRYGISPTYVPASPTIGLPQNRATEVEFRKPGDPSAKVAFRLAPRVMKTLIELGPSGASWPGTPVKMRVGLWDGAGKLLSKGDDMDVLVTVNARRVPVAWRETTDGLKAELGKQAGAGPWVIRVNVQDKRGRTLARDFLEVAAK